MKLGHQGIVAMVLFHLVLCHFCNLLFHSILSRFFCSYAANAPSPYLPSTPGQPMTPSSASYLPGTPGGQPMTPGAGGLDAMSPVIGTISDILNL